MPIYQGDDDYEYRNHFLSKFSAKSIVFHLKETCEIFDCESEYKKQKELYNQQKWQCCIERGQNLVFLDALKCEEKCFSSFTLFSKHEQTKIFSHLMVEFYLLPTRVFHNVRSITTFIASKIRLNVSKDILLSFILYLVKRKKNNNLNFGIKKSCRSGLGFSFKTLNDLFAITQSNKELNTIKSIVSQKFKEMFKLASDLETGSNQINLSTDESLLFSPFLINKFIYVCEFFNKFFSPTMTYFEIEDMKELVDPEILESKLLVENFWNKQDHFFYNLLTVFLKALLRGFSLRKIPLEIFESFKDSDSPKILMLFKDYKLGVFKKVMNLDKLINIHTCTHVLAIFLLLVAGRKETDNLLNRFFNKYSDIRILLLKYDSLETVLSKVNIENIDPLIFKLDLLILCIDFLIVQSDFINIYSIYKSTVNSKVTENISQVLGKDRFGRSYSYFESFPGFIIVEFDYFNVFDSIKSNDFILVNEFLSLPYVSIENDSLSVDKRSYMEEYFYKKNNLDTNQQELYKLIETSEDPCLVNIRNFINVRIQNLVDNYTNFKKIVEYVDNNVEKLTLIIKIKAIEEEKYYFLELRNFLNKNPSSLEFVLDGTLENIVTLNTKVERVIKIQTSRKKKHRLSFFTNAKEINADLLSSFILEIISTIKKYNLYVEDGSNSLNYQKEDANIFEEFKKIIINMYKKVDVKAYIPFDAAKDYFERENETFITSKLSSYSKSFSTKDWKTSLMQCENFTSLYFHLYVFYKHILFIMKEYKDQKCSKCFSMYIDYPTSLCVTCSKQYHFKCIKKLYDQYPDKRFAKFGYFVCHYCKNDAVDKKSNKRNEKKLCKTCLKQINITEDIIKCKKCLDNFHKNCANVKSKRLSVSWKCNSCVDEITNENKILCNNCNTGGVLVSCHGCFRNYHFVCVEPILRKAPKGYWLCNVCINGPKRRSQTKRMNEFK